MPVIKVKHYVIVSVLSGTPCFFCLYMTCKEFDTDFAIQVHITFITLFKSFFEKLCYMVIVFIISPQSLMMKLKEALATSDIVVTTGGVSMGEKDLLKEVLVADLGAVIHFGRVKMKPGYVSPYYFIVC
jgi:hypothetical protein